jgi:hypothetical protein
MSGLVVSLQNQRRDCLTLAACCPSARRVFFGKCFKVCFRFAAFAAFLMFFRATARCFWVAIKPPSLSGRSFQFQRTKHRHDFNGTGDWVWENRLAQHILDQL